MAVRTPRRIAFLIAFLVALFSIGFASYLTALYRSEPSSIPTEWQAVMAWTYLAWPLLFMAALHRGSRKTMAVAFVGYLAQSLWLGLSVGGPHLTFGVLPFLVALILGFVAQQERAPPAQPRRRRMPTA